MLSLMVCSLSTWDHWLHGTLIISFINMSYQLAEVMYPLGSSTPLAGSTSPLTKRLQFIACTKQYSHKHMASIFVQPCLRVSSSYMLPLDNAHPPLVKVLLYMLLLIVPIIWTYCVTDCQTDCQCSGMDSLFQRSVSIRLTWTYCVTVHFLPSYIDILTVNVDFLSSVFLYIHR